MHPYPKLFTRANDRVQCALPLQERWDTMALAVYAQLFDDEGRYPCLEDAVVLSNYGLITWNPN